MNEHRHIIIEGEELYHYGVKGMKWKNHVYAVAEKAGDAVRTSAEKVAGAASAFAKKFGQNARRITRSAKARLRTKIQDARRKRYERDKVTASFGDRAKSYGGPLSKVVGAIRTKRAKKRLARQKRIATSNRVSEIKRNRRSELRNQAALNKGTSRSQHKQNQRIRNYNNRVAGQAQIKSYADVDARSSGRTADSKRNATRNAITSATMNKGRWADMSGRTGKSMNTLTSSQNSAKKAVLTANTSNRKKKAQTKSRPKTY